MISWGRTYESFGEDPELVSELGAAAVRGFQGKLPQGNSVLACAKHFMATAAPRAALTRATPCATKRRCAECICRPTSPQ